MYVCPNCGRHVEQGVSFCPACGSPVSASAPAQAAAVGVTPAPAPGPFAADTYRSGYQSAAQGTPAVAALTPEQDIAQNKTMAVIAYLIFFVPLIAGAHKTSPFVRFHTNQATVLVLAALAYGIVYGVLTTVLTLLLMGAGTWGVMLVLTSVLSLLFLVFPIFGIIGLVMAATGKMTPLPLVGSIRLLK